MPTNPYDFTKPIRDRRFFAGRKRELEEVKYYFEQATGESPKFLSLALIGKRASGKTSLLNMIGLMAKDMAFLPVKIPLNNELVTSDVAFFKEVFDGIMTQGSEVGMYGGFGQKTYKQFRKLIDTLDLKVELPLLFGTAYVGSKSGSQIGLPQHVVVHDLNEMVEEARKTGLRGIVLLLDECDLLSTNEIMLQKMRNIFQDIDGYILVLAGTETMFPKLSQVFSPIPRFFKRIDLKDFESYGETLECIEMPLSEEERRALQYTTARDIHAFTKGSPYEINLVSHFMYRRYIEGKSKEIELTVGVLDDIMSEIERLREGGHHEVASKVKELTLEDLEMLQYLSDLEPRDRSTFIPLTLLIDLESLDVENREGYLEKNAAILDHLVRIGTVHESENGMLTLEGDDFDKLYVKYLASSKGVLEVPSGDAVGRISGYLTESILRQESCSTLVLFSSEAAVSRGQYDFSHAIIPDKPWRIDRIAVPFFLPADSKEVTGVELSSQTADFGADLLYAYDSHIEDKAISEIMTEFSEKMALAGLTVVWPSLMELLYEGILAYEQGDYQKTLMSFRQAEQAGAKGVAIDYNLAVTLHRLGDLHGAVERCSKMLEGASKIRRPEMTGVWILASVCQRDNGNMEEALKLIDKAIRLNPKSVDAWREKAESLQLKGQAESAEECMRRARSLRESDTMKPGGPRRKRET